MDNNELFHFGTKMHSGRFKWGSGERPFQRLGGVGRKESKKSIKSWTDEELASKIKRLEQEKRYNDLSKNDVSYGKKILDDTLKTVAKTTLTTVLSSAATYAAVKTIAGKEVSLKGFGDYLATKTNLKKVSNIATPLKETPSKSSQSTLKKNENIQKEEAPKNKSSTDYKKYFESLKDQNFENEYKKFSSSLEDKNSDSRFSKSKEVVSEAMNKADTILAGLIKESGNKTYNSIKNNFNKEKLSDVVDNAESLIKRLDKWTRS